MGKMGNAVEALEDSGLTEEPPKSEEQVDEKRRFPVQ